MQNRLKQLPPIVQKWVYEISGRAGTICLDSISTEYNHAMGAFLSATDEELDDFLDDHARYNLEYRISWHDALQEAYGAFQWRRVYSEYLRAPEWRRKRESVMKRALRPLLPECPKVRVSVQANGLRIPFITPDSKPLCEQADCSHVAKQVHHWNYDRVGKEQIGPHADESEENDLIALCRPCHAALHAKKKQRH